MRRFKLFPILFLVTAQTFGQVPLISSFAPLSAKAGDTLTIEGQNFSADINASLVIFGAVKASIISASSTVMRVIVPFGAAFSPLTYLNASTGLSCRTLRSFSPYFLSSNTTGSSKLEPALNGFPKSYIESYFQINQAAAGPYALNVCDMDGDGKPDVVMTNTTNAFVSVFRNISDSGGGLSTSSFAPAVNLQLSVGTTAVDINLSDLDGDGKPDIITANNTSSISVIKNNSTPGTISLLSFDDRIDIALATSGTVQPQFLAVHDLNGDGTPEIVVACRQNAAFSIIKNNCSPGNLSLVTFSPPVNFNGGTHPSGVAVADFDNDNKPDVITVADNSVVLHRNQFLCNNNGDFVAQGNELIFSIPSAANYGLITADIDSDGKEDFLITSRSLKSMLLFRNNYNSGAFTTTSFDPYFQLTVPIINGAAVSTVMPRFSDINGDAKNDIILPVANQDSLYVYFNKTVPGSAFNISGFQSPLGITVPKNGRFVAACDLNKDGRPDLALANAQTGNLLIFENRIPIPASVMIDSSSLSADDKIRVGISVKPNGYNCQVRIFCRQVSAPNTVTVITKDSVASQSVKVSWSDIFGGLEVGNAYQIWATAANAAGVLHTDTVRFSLTPNRIIKGSILSTSCQLNQNLKFTSDIVPTRLEWYKNEVLVKQSEVQFTSVPQNVVGPLNGWQTGRDFYIDPFDNMYFLAGTGLYKLKSGSQTPEQLIGANGQGTALNQLFNPNYFAVDQDENLYVNDYYNTHRLVYWPAGAASGQLISTVFSFQPGSAYTWSPYELAVDNTNTLYAVDIAYSKVLRWTQGIQSLPETIFGGTAGNALNQLNSPNGILKNNDTVYIADTDNARVLRWKMSEGQGEVIAGGNGEGSGADQLFKPRSIYRDKLNNIYIAEEQNRRVSMWKEGAVTGRTLVSGGQGSALTSFEALTKVKINSRGELFTGETHNNRILKHVPSIDSSLFINSAGTYKVRAYFHNGSVLERTIEMQSVPVQPGSFTQASLSVCAGTSAVPYTIPLDPSVTYAWNYSGAGVTINGSGKTVTLDFSSSATSGVLSVTASKNGCTSSPRNVTVTVPSVSMPGPFSAGPPSVCLPKTDVTYSIVEDPSVSYVWSYSGTGVQIAGNGGAVALSFTNNATAGDLTVKASRSGCVSAPRTMSITPVTSVMPSFVMMSSNVCKGALGVTYSVVNDPGTNYIWSYSGVGAQIIGSGSNVSVNYSTGATGGALQVTAVKNGCTGPAATVQVSVHAFPAAPIFSSGASSVCTGASGIGYSVIEDMGVTYTWSYSGTGATITGTGDHITVDFAQNATSGNLTVIPFKNGCQGTSAIFAVSVKTTPSAPVITSGPSTVCQGSAAVPYTVLNDPSVNYIWNYTGYGGLVTGNTASVLLDYALTALSGSVQVTALQNGCYSAVTNFPVSVNPVPAQPSVIGGSSKVCTGSTLTYSVINDPAVTYSWTYSGAGATIGTPALNSTSIDFTASAAGGSLTLTAFKNGCLSSSSLPIDVVTSPAAPGFLSGTAKVCAGASVSYSIDTVPGLIYTWSYTGSGAAMSNLKGSMTTVKYGTGATGGDLRVTAATGGCSSSSMLAVTVTAVSQLSFLTGTAKVCSGTTDVSYSVPNDATVSYAWSYSGAGVQFSSGSGSIVKVSFADTATSGTVTVTALQAGCTVASDMVVNVSKSPQKPMISGPSTVCSGATGISYTVPSVPTVDYKWSYSGTGAVISTQNGSTTKMDLSLPATGGLLTVAATANGCSTSADLSVSVNPGLQQPLIAGVAEVCTGLSEVSYGVSPDSTVNYTWSYSGTGVILNALSGNIVKADFADSATSGNLIVTAVRAGCSVTSGIAVSVSKAPQKPSVSGSASVCSGTAGISYAVSAVPSVNYKWTYSGTGAVVNTPDSSTVKLDFSSLATAGILKVVATAGGCSSSGDLPVSLSAGVAEPLVITGPLKVCAGTKGILYNVKTDSSLTFSWSYSGSGTIINNAKSSEVTVDFSESSTAGNLIVTAAKNGCSASFLIPIAISTPPAVPSVPEGSIKVCPGSSGLVYSVPAVADVTFTWYYTGTGAQINTPTNNKTTIDFAAGASAGKLKLTVTKDGCSNFSELSIVLLSPPAPLSFVFGSVGVCPGSAAMVYSVQEDSAAVYAWSYTGSGAVIAKPNTCTISIDFAATATSGNLIVTATKDGCHTSAVMPVTVNLNGPAQPLIITGNAAVCPGTAGVPYNVPADSTVKYIWTYSGTGAVIKGAGGSNITVDYKPDANSGMLSVTALKNGCQATATVNIIVKKTPLSPTKFTVLRNEVCQQTNDVIYAVAPDPTLTYKWSYTAGGVNITSAANAANFDFTATALSGMVSVTSVADGCESAPLTLPVHVIESTMKIQPNFVYPDICTTSNAVFTNTTDTAMTKLCGFNWDYGNGLTSSAVNGSSGFPKSGVYAVTLTAFVQACPSLKNSVTKNITVVKPPPGIAYDTIVALRGAPVALSARNIGSIYSWSPSTGLSFPASSNPTLTAIATQVYLISITAQNGCRTVDTQLVKVATRTGIYAPTMFSPNGDGRNDVFAPLLISMKKLNFFRVYNRWGNPVYEQQNIVGPVTGWNGKYKGVDQPVGVYVWIAEGVDTDNRIIRVDGNTVLIR